MTFLSLPINTKIGKERRFRRGLAKYVSHQRGASSRCDTHHPKGGQKTSLSILYFLVTVD